MISRTLKLLIAILAIQYTLLAWASDPTRPDIIKPSKKSEVVVRQLQLTMVRMAKDKPSAIINGQLLHLGDQIAGYKLTRITPEQVVLTNNKGQLRLNLITRGALRKSS